MEGEKDMIRAMFTYLVDRWKAYRAHEAAIKILRGKCRALEVERIRLESNLVLAKAEWDREVARSRELEARMAEVLRFHPARGQAPQGA